MPDVLARVRLAGRDWPPLTSALLGESVQVEVIFTGPDGAALEAGTVTASAYRPPLPEETAGTTPAIALTRTGVGIWVGALLLDRVGDWAIDARCATPSAAVARADIRVTLGGPETLGDSRGAASASTSASIALEAATAASSNATAAIASAAAAAASAEAARRGETIVEDDAGTAWSFTSDAAGQLRRFTASTLVTVTLPAAALGSSIQVEQAGTGQVRFVAGANAAIVNRLAHDRTAGRYARAGAVVVSTAGGVTTWNLAGDTDA
jgi:hypothetical protein